MPRPHLIAASLLIALTAVLPAATSRAAVNAGDRVDFTLKLMDRTTVSVADLRNKLTVVEFWATWCPPCVAAVPHLREIHATYAPRGVELISVSLDRDAAVAKRFIKEHQMTWRQAHDGSQRRPLSDGWGVESIPTAFVIAPGGKVLWRGHPTRMEAEIKKALEAHGDDVAEASLEIKPAIKAMLKVYRDLDKRPDAMAELAELILMVPAEHYQHPAVARTAGRLHTRLGVVDPEGARLQAALDAKQPDESQALRVAAFMNAAGADQAAHAQRPRDAA